MELRHLRSFVALAEELHFGRAAQRVFVAQPALSKQISALEKELGVLLFERDKRQVVLTTAGVALLEDARRLLTQADGAVERARSAGRGSTGMLRVGFIAPALYDLLPPVLRAFRVRHPGVRLALEEMHNIEAVNAVRSRRVHIAFVRLPIEPVSELSLVTVRSEPVMLAVPEGSRLADREAVHLAELADTDLILIARSQEPELHDYYVAQCAAAGFSARISHEVDRTHVAIGLVASGLGVCFVPRSGRRVAQPGVVCVPLLGTRMRLTMAAAWLGDPDPLVRNFLALCTDVRPQDPGPRAGTVEPIASA
ncbi:LysR family transcriptional regulator [Pseudonocardia xinjiangensis]|uniref:LysR family transcriptional regulator n=1 Tax=Pseudonocardia xinjiangensis TaxID=75289 RepID=A0ABX1RI95_9PSEU|nr:LysR family transcriptional regulator [Pseudonocardia xinjiangensis]NMH80116.1 LysR family transcriptional regulator [Pseudonocardia xinjiangensis]